MNDYFKCAKCKKNIYPDHYTQPIAPGCTYDFEHIDCENPKILKKSDKLGIK